MKLQLPRKILKDGLLLLPMNPLLSYASLHTDQVGVAGEQLFLGPKVAESVAALQIVEKNEFFVWGCNTCGNILPHR